VIGWCAVAFALRCHVDQLIGCDRFSESLKRMGGGEAGDLEELREVWDGPFLRALYDSGLITQDDFDRLKEYRDRRNDAAHVKDLRHQQIDDREGVDLLEYGVRRFIPVRGRDAGFVPAAFIVDTIRDLNYPVETQAEVLVAHARRDNLLALIERLLDTYFATTDTELQERTLLVWSFLSQRLNRREKANSNRYLASLLPEADQDIEIEELVERISLRQVVFMPQLNRVARKTRRRIVKILTKEASLYFSDDRDFIAELLGYAEDEDYRECARLLADLEMEGS